jgi:hypothetical protein
MDFNPNPGTPPYWSGFNVLVINEFKFLSACLLGAGIMEGIEGSNMKVTKFSLEDYQNHYLAFTANRNGNEEYKIPDIVKNNAQIGLNLKKEYGRGMTSSGTSIAKYLIKNEFATLDKIKNIYSLLPFYLKPGIKTWNQKSLTFDNGCRVKTSARTKTPAIGFTIDVLYLDEFAHIPSNIIEPYYTAVYPTVSAITTSKIIITSTPNGMNLFYRLLTDSERPDGDPLKLNYNAIRVYWYEVPGRFVTYIRLNAHKMHEFGVTKEDIFKVVNDKWSNVTKVEMHFIADKMKDVIYVFNNNMCNDIDIKKMNFIDKNNLETPILSIAEITTWKDETMKDIGGEDAFEQEYGLKFINASKSLLNESIIEDLLNNKKNYEYVEIAEFTERLRFSYKDLKWVDDDNIFKPSLRKEYKYIISVDISEGLGQDYSVINIFRISQKPKELIELQKASYKSIIDFFRLEQVGI